MTRLRLLRAWRDRGYNDALKSRWKPPLIEEFRVAYVQGHGRGAEEFERIQAETLR